MSTMSNFTIDSVVVAVDGSGVDERAKQAADQIASISTAIEVTTVDGTSADEIIRLASRSPGSIICMVDPGRTAVGDLVKGSATEAVLDASDQPVIVVGPHARPDMRGPIVVCVDDSRGCEAIVGPAVALGELLEVPLVFVEVVPPEERVEVDGVSRSDLATAQGRRRLRQVSAQATAMGSDNVDIAVLYGADIARAIAEFATDRGASAIAVATHARGGVRRVLRGSITHHLIAAATCPVLTVHCD